MWPGGGRTPSPLVGLVLISDTPPDRPSPPMNSLPPRRCPPIGLDGVVGVVNGECGGVVATGGARVAAAGLKEKSGRALTDFCRNPGAEPRRPVGYACSDIGRVLGTGTGSEGKVSGPRCGKVKSGLGMSSMSPALEA